MVSVGANALSSEGVQRLRDRFVLGRGHAFCSRAVCANPGASRLETFLAESQTACTSLQVLLSECADAYSCR